MNIALIERYPGTAALPRVDLCDLPTPVKDVHVDELHIDVRGLRVKCDDLTSRAYGGNKVRKLEFLLGRASDEERRAVVTFGAYGSNHALATAVHARAVGLEPHVVLSPQAPTPYARATLLAHAALGSVIHLAEGWDGTRVGVRAKQALEEVNGVAPLVIPMGGTNGLGAVGYVNAALEVDAEEAPTVVYLAGGTLGTALGLSIGFAALEVDTRVVAVRVTPAEVANEEFARRVTAETVATLREVDRGFPELGFDELGFEMRDDWFEPGYGVVTPETLEAVRLAAEAGVALETTYTGKAFAALLADAGSGAIHSERVLFWNTYNSAPMPAPGAAASLPGELQEYVAECDRLFGGGSETPDEAVAIGGDTE